MFKYKIYGLCGQGMADTRVRIWRSFDRNYRLLESVPHSIFFRFDNLSSFENIKII